MATYSSVLNGRGRSLRRGESRRPGQWKLAYADFLTALMAFFLLMWLATEQSVAERGAIAAYFTGGTVSDTVTPVSDLQANLLSVMETNPEFSGLSGHIHLTNTPNGVRIDLSETSGAPLFSNADTALNATGIHLLSEMGALIADYPTQISVEGHTDAFKTHTGAYSNWDISSRRAAAAQHVLQQAGIAPDRFEAVVGLADTLPLNPNQPHAPINRRISIILELPG